MTRLLVAFVLLLATVRGASAQTPQTFHDMLSVRIAEIQRLRAEAATNMAANIEEQVNVRRTPIPFFLFAHAQNLPRELRLIEDARTDKQLGSPAATSGSTSLVSRAGVPRILAFAVENGALTQTGDATTTTLRGNAVGWLDLVQGQDIIASYDDDSRFTRALRAISYSFTYNIAQPNEATSAERPDPATVQEEAEAGSRQLAAFSARVAIIDQRDPRRLDNRAAVATTLAGSSTALGRSLDPFDAFFLSDVYEKWLVRTKDALATRQKLSKTDVERTLYAQLEELRKLMEKDVPDFPNQVAQVVNSLQAFDSRRNAVFQKLLQRFVMATEYVQDRPARGPTSSTFRVIGEGRPGNTRLDLTFNVAATRQHDGTALVPQPTPTGGWRDVQIGLSAELPYGKDAAGAPCDKTSGGIGRPVIAIEYLSRRLLEKAVVNFAGHDFSVEPGWIHVAQAKVTIPMKGSGVKVPFSVSFANRTELLREKNVRAHIGLTFDLDVLASAVRP